MSGDKCVYLNCNLTRRLSNNTFHRFPSNIELHEQWIVNSGKYSKNKIQNIYNTIKKDIGRYPIVVFEQ